LAPVPAGSAPAPSAAAGPGSLADAAKAATDGKDKEVKSGGPAKDQAYWSGRRKALQDKLDRGQTFTAALQTRINSLAADVVNRDDPAQRTLLERERQKALAELARLQQDLATEKKALADLDEEARRAGVPPGWLR
jgi:chromosome segregation ATPase